MKKNTEKVLERKTAVLVRVKVTPDAKRELIERDGESFVISVREPREHNLANKRLREIIASEMDTALPRVRLIKGHRSSNKVFTVTS